MRIECNKVSKKARKTSFVPKIPSVGILNIAKAIAPETEIEVIGIRPGEKLHEIMIPADDARRTVDKGDHYVILPDSENLGEQISAYGGAPCPEGFEYRSDNNPEWVDDISLLSLLDPRYRTALIRSGSAQLAENAVASASF